jgi:hypothetical protein
MTHSISPLLGRQSQEDYKFEASLGKTLWKSGLQFFPNRLNWCGVLVIDIFLQLWDFELVRIHTV